jgi:hypothetical protein
MKTEALIDLLARQAGPAPRAVAARRMTPAVLGGLLASAGVAMALFGLLPPAMFATAVPWMKIAYASALALAAAWLTARLSRPAAPTGRAQAAVLAVVLVMALVGAASLVAAPPGARWQAWLGLSGLACPWRVLLLSVPALAALLWAVRGLAPTRPQAAGFAAGLLAGAVGAIGYSLSCPEASPAFVAIWYTAGIVLTGALGAALGPRVLRW